MRPRNWLSLKQTLAIIAVHPLGMYAVWFAVSRESEADAFWPVIVLCAGPAIVGNLVGEGSNSFYGFAAMLMSSGVLYSLYAYALTTFRMRVAIPLVLGTQATCGLTLLAWAHFKGIV